eukprot:616675-Pleurochrysis_carterae.AAC.2
MSQDRDVGGTCAHRAGERTRGGGVPRRRRKRRGGRKKEEGLFATFCGTARETRLNGEREWAVMVKARERESERRKERQENK